jgi:hypothetical protein
MELLMPQTALQVIEFPFLNLFQCSSLVPFDEDSRNPKVWFLDHNFLENMFRMHRKVNGNFSLRDRIRLLSHHFRQLARK